MVIPISSARWDDSILCGEDDLGALDDCLKLCNAIGMVVTKNLVLVNVATQRLYLIEGEGYMRSYLISTAKNGVGQKKDTGQTPLGLHCIQEKIGDGASPFAIFKSRVLTGTIAEEGDGGDLIVGRILWLSGLQEGFNKCGDVDTHNRYIYIHGTNDTFNLGKPVSAGCVRMDPKDVIELFDQVEQNSLVYIYV